MLRCIHLESFMTALRCPVCQNDLSIGEKSYVCGSGHNFDIARQGYVNLLLSSQRPSKAPGDSAEMIADRRAFLDAGHYQQLRDRVLDRLDRLASRADADADAKRTQQVLDLGCGEGYYTAAFANPLKRRLYALDISKPALIIAAKRSSAVTWCIGTSRALPFHDASLDVVVNIFCRPHIAETRRVLRENGVLLLVGPGNNHLDELRAVLYDEVIKQDSHSPAELLTGGFNLQHSETLSYRITLQGAEIGQLARMTPHYWRASQAGRERLAALDTLTLQTDFVLQEFTPANQQPVANN
jgi:23S rRNA (guanine745-N1)-methyltransferase